MRLTSWREVIHPRDDVMRGKLTLSSFAADLGDVALGRGSNEYAQPEEFFAATYLTDGLKRLLAKALERVSGRGGDSVIQIKTAFGGGKTHSMLALYHMMKNSWPVDEVLRITGMRAVPKVNVAVLAFDHKNPLKPDYVSGIRTRTLFGAMSAQLGGYEYVRANDEQGISPGKEDLLRMFDELGPCVVLMDELVAYGRKIRVARGKREDWSYGNFLTFIHELTEAVSQSRNSLVVATLPESETEAGGDDGVAVLHEVEHLFGRIESVWKPVTAREGFEIVKKRLFGECVDESARDETAESFALMYRNNPNDFPFQTRDSAYLERLKECYPFHPELFDRLYEDWSTLERFQRTRGVLRLLAHVVRELCAKGDEDALIMPGSLPLSNSDVMEGLTQALPSHDVWDGIVASDIDGERSASLVLDMSSERFSQLCACRRNARTIMLGSAPFQGKEALKGVERPSVLLGSVRPGDNIAAYNEALNTMKGELSYLYTDGGGNRYWFDTMPNLQKTVRMRSEGVESYKVEEEIRERLMKHARDSEHMFAGVHVWPDSSQGVPDDDEGVRLVLMKPEVAEEGMREFLLTHGSDTRAHLNSIVFLCGSWGEVQDLRRKVRMLLAWKGIDADPERLNLGVRQLREVKENITRSEVEVDNAVKMSWRKVYSPTTRYGDRLDAIEWDKGNVSGNGGIIASVVECLMDLDLVIFRGRRYAPEQLLSKLNSCNLWLGKSEIAVRDLWNDICSYSYLHKVSSYEVLAVAIREGVKAGEFGYASGERDGIYEALKFMEECSVEKSGYIVKREAAMEQKASECGANQVEPTPELKPKPEGPNEGKERQPEKRESKVMRFHMHTDLEEQSMLKKVKAIYSEVVENLRGGGEFRQIQLSIDFEVSGELSEEIRSAVEANCKALKVDYAEFE